MANKTKIMIDATDAKKQLEDIARQAANLQKSLRGLGGQDPERTRTQKQVSALKVTATKLQGQAVAEEKILKMRKQTENLYVKSEKHIKRGNTQIGKMWRQINKVEKSYKKTVVAAKDLTNQIAETKRAAAAELREVTGDQRLVSLKDAKRLQQEYTEQIEKSKKAQEELAKKGKLKDYKKEGQRIKELEQKLNSLSEIYNKYASQLRESGEELGQLSGRMGNQREEVEEVTNTMRRYLDTLDESDEEHERFSMAMAETEGILEDMEEGYQEYGDTSSTVIHQATRLEDAHRESLDRSSNSLTTKIIKGYLYMQVMRLIRRIISSVTRNIKELDKALTEVAVVTDKNRQGAWELLKTYQMLGKEVGMTSKEVAKLSIHFFRQGRSQRDVIKLTRIAAKSAKVAGIDAESAANYLTSAVNGFSLAAEDAIDVADKFASLGAQSASSFEELALALSKVAPGAQAAGVELDNMLAFLAKTIETTREAPENIGTAFKTIFARMRELKDFGKTMEDDMNVNKVETALKSIGVHLRDNSGEFRNLDKVLIEVGKKWKTMTKNQQAYIATTLAGTRQQTRLMGLFQDFDRTLELIEKSQESAGAMAAQHADYMTGLEVATNKLSIAWEGFTASLAASETAILLTKALTGLVNILNTPLVGDNGGLPSTLISLGTALVAINWKKIIGLVAALKGMFVKAAAGGAAAAASISGLVVIALALIPIIIKIVKWTGIFDSKTTKLAKGIKKTTEALQEFENAKAQAMAKKTDLSDAIEQYKKLRNQLYHTTEEAEKFLKLKEKLQEFEVLDPSGTVDPEKVAIALNKINKDVEEKFEEAQKIIEKKLGGRKQRTLYLDTLIEEGGIKKTLRDKGISEEISQRAIASMLIPDLDPQELDAMAQVLPNLLEDALEKQRKHIEDVRKEQIELFLETQKKEGGYAKELAEKGILTEEYQTWVNQNVEAAKEGSDDLVYIKNALKDFQNEMQDLIGMTEIVTAEDKDIALARIFELSDEEIQGMSRSLSGYLTTALDQLFVTAQALGPEYAKTISKMLTGTDLEQQIVKSIRDLDHTEAQREMLKIFEKMFNIQEAAEGKTIQQTQFEFLNDAVYELQTNLGNISPEKMEILDKIVREVANSFNDVDKSIRNIVNLQDDLPTFSEMAKNIKEGKYTMDDFLQLKERFPNAYKAILAGETTVKKVIEEEHALEIQKTQELYNQLKIKKFAVEDTTKLADLSYEEMQNKAKVLEIGLEDLKTQQDKANLIYKMGKGAAELEYGKGAYDWAIAIRNSYSEIVAHLGDIKDGKVDVETFLKFKQKFPAIYRSLINGETSLRKVIEQEYELEYNKALMGQNQLKVKKANLTGEAQLVNLSAKELQNKKNTLTTRLNELKVQQQMARMIESMGRQAAEFEMGPGAYEWAIATRDAYVEVQKQLLAVGRAQTARADLDALNETLRYMKGITYDDPTADIDGEKAKEVNKIRTEIELLGIALDNLNDKVSNLDKLLEMDFIPEDLRSILEKQKEGLLDQITKNLKAQKEILMETLTDATEGLAKYSDVISFDQEGNIIFNEEAYKDLTVAQKDALSDLMDAYEKSGDDIDSINNQIIDSYSNRAEEIKKMYDKEREAIEDRYTSEISALREKFAAERAEEDYDTKSQDLVANLQNINQQMATLGGDISDQAQAKLTALEEQRSALLKEQKMLAEERALEQIIESLEKEKEELLEALDAKQRKELEKLGEEISIMATSNELLAQSIETLADSLGIETDLDFEGLVAPFEDYITTETDAAGKTIVYNLTFDGKTYSSDNPEEFLEGLELLTNRMISEL